LLGTVDDTAVVTVQGAKRFEQIGSDAADKLLDGIVTGSEVTKMGRSACIVVDLHIGVGNIFDAFVTRRRNSSVPVFYIGAGEDTTTLEWLRKTKRDELADLFGDDKLIVPGHVKAPKAPWDLFRRSRPHEIRGDPESPFSLAVTSPRLFSARTEEPPTSLLESAPPKPTLNLLVIEDNQTLKVPETVIKQWYHDSRFGSRFKEWLDGFTKEFGQAPLLCPPAPHVPHAPHAQSLTPLISLTPNPSVTSMGIECAHPGLRRFEEILGLGDRSDCDHSDHCDRDTLSGEAPQVGLGREGDRRSAWTGDHGRPPAEHQGQGGQAGAQHSPE
jgi:hypothetical protein